MKTPTDKYKNFLIFNFNKLNIFISFLVAVFGDFRRFLPPIYRHKSGIELARQPDLIGWRPSGDPVPNEHIAWS